MSSTARLPRAVSSHRETGVRKPSADTSKRMAVTRAHDNPRELEIRSALHRLGYRFNPHGVPLQDLRRSADILFRARKVAVFLDGCFWHGCPWHATWPKRNAAWWREKILRNKQRDRETNARLREGGWQVIRVWDHVPLTVAVNRIAAALQSGLAGRDAAA